MKGAECGAVTHIERFGGSLTLNVHLHVLVIDGAYVRDPDGLLLFRPCPPPSHGAIERVARRVHDGALRWLKRQHYLDEREAEDRSNDLHPSDALARSLVAAARWARGVSGEVSAARHHPPRDDTRGVCRTNFGAPAPSAISAGALPRGVAPHSRLRSTIVPKRRPGVAACREYAHPVETPALPKTIARADLSAATKGLRGPIQVYQLPPPLDREGRIHADTEEAASHHAIPRQVPRLRLGDKRRERRPDFRPRRLIGRHDIEVASHAVPRWAHRDRRAGASFPGSSSGIPSGRDPVPYQMRVHVEESVDAFLSGGGAPNPLGCQEHQAARRGGTWAPTATSMSSMARTSGATTWLPRAYKRSASSCSASDISRQHRSSAPTSGDSISGASVPPATKRLNTSSTRGPIALCGSNHGTSLHAGEVAASAPW